MSGAPLRPVAGEGFAAAILGGGQGKRLGMSKLHLAIGGRTVLGHIIGCLRDTFPSILVILKSDNHVPHDAAWPGVELIPDALPSSGPLVGIYTALLHSPAPYVFVMACDMPCPNMELVSRMLREAEGWEAVVPRMSDHLEPLFAVYRRDVLGKVRDFLDQDRLKIPELIAQLDVRYVEKEEVAACDPEFLSFFNINTRKDLEHAQRTMGRFMSQRSATIVSSG